MIKYVHFAGPSYPIHQVEGKEVQDPFVRPFKRHTSKPVVMSDGFKDFHADGTRSTSFPFVTHKQWVQQGSKRAKK